MRRIVALFVLSFAPAFAFAMPAQALPTNTQGEVQANSTAVDDTQESNDRPVTPRATGTDLRSRRPARSTARPATRAQSFLPGMFR